MIMENLIRKKRSILIILLVLIFGIGSRYLTLDKAQASEAQSVIINNQVIGEGNDFATKILGLPWNMSSPPYPDYITVFDNFDRGSLSIQNGMWSINTQERVPYDPNIWLHSPGIENTQKVLRIGDRFPIDTSVYRLLSIRMCSDISDYMNVYWYLTQLKENSSQIIFHYSQYINIKQGCHLYSIDLEKMPTFVGSWDGMVLGLRLDPGAQGPKAHLEFDWVRLTTLDTSNIVPITWSNVPSGSTITFYLNGTCSLANAIPIGKINQVNTNGTFNWGASALAVESHRPWMLYALPEAFEPGEYKIVMQIGDQPLPSCAQSDINIRKAPLLTFQKPSMYSGPDYATDLLQDPWGMSNPEDIMAVNKITHEVWENGVYSAIAEAVDAYFYPNQEESFNTNKYHYATVRMKVDGTGNNFVSVQRYIWWYTSPAVDVVTTEDMLVREGWHTYSFDLDTAIIDNTESKPKTLDRESKCI